MRMALLLWALLATGNPYEGKPDAVRAGAKLYARHCAQCHGLDAEGHGHAPSLRSSTVQAASAEELFHTVTNGRMSRGMPSWAQLPAERRWQIITYLRSLK
ncbi:MAG TPA: c-type cytochrome [Bryobacteraceae bacterium]|nr:c-type cytochrome [Bryobacteraceae bacterium]